MRFAVCACVCVVMQHLYLFTFSFSVCENSVEASVCFTGVRVSS